MNFFDRAQVFNHRAILGAKRIALVGNGGLKPEDRSIIEQADLVIRFNNYATRENIDTDRTRCDLLWTTGDTHSVGAMPHSVCIGIPYPFKVDSLPGRIKKWYPKAEAFIVNPYWCYDMCRELDIPSEGWKHPFPSIGFTCLWHLHRILTIAPSLKPTISVVGFNWYWNEESKTIQRHYMRSENYPKHWNHNYPKEVRWIIKNLLGNPRFTFSPSCLRILYTVLNQIKK